MEEFTDFYFNNEGLMVLLLNTTLNVVIAVRIHANIVPGIMEK